MSVFAARITRNTTDTVTAAQTPLWLIRAFISDPKPRDYRGSAKDLQSESPSKETWIFHSPNPLQPNPLPLLSKSLGSFRCLLFKLIRDIRVTCHAVASRHADA